MCSVGRRCAPHLQEHLQPRTAVSRVGACHGLCTEGGWSWLCDAPVVMEVPVLLLTVSLTLTHLHVLLGSAGPQTP